MLKLFKKSVAAAACAAMVAAALSGCEKNAGAVSKAEKTNLTFQIWDTAQKEGMEALAAAYTEKNPDTTVEVQVTSWDEYWTKLEAAAEGNQLPDIFWMHTNEILKYADNGILADTTNLYDNESKTYYKDHFSEVSLNNAQGSDGKMYGIPKDKDTVGLVYNKEMFDAAGVSYPNEDWTWEDLVSASEKIHEATGKYGYMAYADDQLGYWNFVYQAGGYILNDDKSEAGFIQPATRKAMEFYIGLQSNEWCPDQNYFAETSPGTAFFSEQGAMYFEGSWNLLASLENNPEMTGKWDVAVLPKCPDPEKGDGRATISNGLCYATAANGKNLEVSKDFLKFLGSEEGQRIQGESGAAIPAYNGLESAWTNVFAERGYKIDVQKYIDMFEYGVQSINDVSRPEWKSKVNDELLNIYSGKSGVEEGLGKMQTIVDDAIAKYQ
nr:sugar ABC transporter substrate-binding protein [uncultured Clostridium sp.]